MPQLKQLQLSDCAGLSPRAMPPRRKNARRALAAISEEAPEEPETAPAVKPEDAASAKLAQVVAELELQGLRLSITRVQRSQHPTGGPPENQLARA